jgi:hypothetical protein
MDSGASEAGSGAAAPLEPMFEQLLAWWEGKRQGRPIPDRRDIDALELGPALLPHLILTDWVGADDHRYRVVGTEIVRWLGHDPTGRLLSETLPGEYRAYMLSLLERVRGARRPIWSSSLARHREGPGIETRRLFLPFTRGAQEVAVVLAIQSFRYPDSEVVPPRYQIIRDAAVEERDRRILGGVD